MKHTLLQLLIVIFLSVASNIHALPPVPVPQTGQTTCYYSTGAIISCAATGQDGELRIGLPWPNSRFVDNGDQTVNDNLTGLVWTKDANLMKTRDPLFDTDKQGSEADNDGAVTFQHALDYVKKLNAENYLGYSDWRLPNRNEIESLVNKEPSYQDTWLSGQGFINVHDNVLGNRYWSSSTIAIYVDTAWIVDMNNGSGGGRRKAVQNVYVWPVRSVGSGSFVSKTGQTSCYDANLATIDCSGTGQDGELQTGVSWPVPRFSDNGDLTVTDKLTGLIWSKDANPATVGKTWQQGLDYIKNLNISNYLGYSDWRLPNRNEIESLVNSLLRRIWLSVV